MFVWGSRLLGSDGTAALQLAAVLEAVALVMLFAGALVGLRASRRQVARLEAIAFVRATFADPLAEGEPLHELLPQLVAALRHAFALDAAEVWLSRTGSLCLSAADPRREAIALPPPAPEALASAGTVAGITWSRAWMPGLLEGRTATALRITPIGQVGAPLGLLVVARARRGWRLAAEADATREELARELGHAIHKAALDAALQRSLGQLKQQTHDLLASRARIVQAADAERRRIERNLHDGAQQYLVALGVKAELIRRLVDTDPRRAGAIGQELAEDAEHAMEALRTLARGIYPMQLGSSGLRAALVEACRQAGVETTLDADGVRRHPAEVEAAIYFCCVEALQNVAKHAGSDAAARVRIWEEPGMLSFEITDDGVGFLAGPNANGAGLANMGDRMGAVGGFLSVESASGAGTRVRGQVPVPGPPG